MQIDKNVDVKMDGCIELLNTIKKLTPNISDRTTDDEANSVWGTYYAQYLDSIWALIHICESSQSNIFYEDIFLPLGLLTTLHGIVAENNIKELWYRRH